MDYVFLIFSNKDFRIEFRDFLYDHFIKISLESNEKKIKKIVKNYNFKRNSPWNIFHIKHSMRLIILIISEIESIN